MFRTNATTFAENCVHNIIVKEKKLWLRNKDIGEKLGVENIYDFIGKEIKGKVEKNNPTEQEIKEYKRHGSKLIDDEKFMYTHEDIITSIIMHCKVSTPKAIEFKSKLGLKQHDITLTREQSVTTKTMKLFSYEKILLQKSVSSYKIDLYFPEHKLAIAVDEKGHTDRDEKNKIKEKKNKRRAWL